MEFLNMTCFIMHFYDLYTIVHAKYDISIYKTHTSFLILFSCY